MEVQKLGELYPLKILVAEDNLINQLVIKRMLNFFGFECVMANDGVEVLEFYKSDASFYHIIFMDLQMPRMGGLEACQKLRTTLPASRQPHIVALTANVLSKEKEYCLANGMDAFLPKPLELAELHRVLIERAKDVYQDRSDNLQIVDSSK